MAIYRFTVGPFHYSVESTISNVQAAMERMYVDYPKSAPGTWDDFHLRAFRKHRFSRLARLAIDSEEPFAPFPVEQAAPVVEWGMNWAIWLNLSHWLVFHAAMLEKNGKGLILAADSGDGKSTLAAALAFRGWRLLSDELTLIDPADCRMVPIPRPICLKNDAIRILRDFLPEAVFSNEYPDTNKGRVAHIRPPKEAVLRMGERVTPRWIVFPKYLPDSPPVWTPWEKAEAVVKLGQNGVDYSTLGVRGFETLTSVIGGCVCRKFEYSRLDDALREFESLSEI